MYHHPYSSYLCLLWLLAVRTTQPPHKQNSASASEKSNASSDTYTTTDGKNKIAFAVNYINANHTLYQWSVTVTSLDPQHYNQVQNNLIQKIYTTDGRTVETSINAKNLNGHYQIIDKPSNTVLEDWTYVNGVRTNLFMYQDVSAFQQYKPCNLSTIHGCVHNKIEGMGFFEYSACLLASVECYGSVWVQCIWDICDAQYF